MVLAVIRDIEVLGSYDGERGLDGNRLVRWSGILFCFPRLTGVPTRGIVSPILCKSSPFYEGLNGVLEVDAVLCQMTMTPVVLTVFIFVYPWLGRSWAGTFDAAVFEICTCALRYDALAGSCKRSVFCEPPRGSPLFPDVSGFIVPSIFSSSSRRGDVWSRIAAGSAVSGVTGSVGRFSLFVVHVGPGLFEEGIVIQWKN